MIDLFRMATKDEGVVSIRLRRELLDELRAIAAAEQRSVSQQIRYVLERYVADRSQQSGGCDR